MSLRTRGILVGVTFVAVALLWFLFFWQPGQSKISKLRKEQAQAQSERTQLEAQLKALRALQQQEPRLRSELARLQDALPSDPRLPDFILQVQEAAGLAGIDFLSISPSLPAPYTPPSASGAASAPAATSATAGQLQAISVSINVTGKYFEIEDFILRLERLRRAVRVNSFTLSPNAGIAAPGASPPLSVGFALQMFMVSATPASTAATPPPSGSPAPGTSPSPSPAPGTTPTPVPTATPRAGG